jgi:hypothetical protein
MRRGKPLACPWSNYPTHARNRQIQVNGERPLVYGYCPHEKDCASCAGTLYKPNLVIEQGRSFLFVECPFCTPDAYRKRVVKMKDLLPVGAGPTSTPLDPPKQPAKDKRMTANKLVPKKPAGHH